MTEKELIKNLSALKSSSINPEWIKHNRATLSYQIFNGAEYSDTAFGFFERISLISKRVLQPTPIAALIAVFLLVGSAFASRNSTPGEPLYIAKTISEKAQLVATFNETSRAKLNLEFARERAAELEKVTANVDAPASEARVQELSTGFKKQLESARSRISKIDSTKKAVPAINEENGVVGAEAGKESKGIEVSDPSQKALEEAEKLFNEKNYNAAAEKLKELGSQLEQ